MQHPRPNVVGAPPVVAGVRPAAPELSPMGVWVLLFATASLLVSLVWDFSWESTVGIDRVWAPAHTAGYLAVALTGAMAFGLIYAHTRSPQGKRQGVRLGRLCAPLGVWLAGWGALCFLAAVIFDRWWQSAYGLAAGIWHPPQILKAIAFFAMAAGAWLAGLHSQNNAPVDRASKGAIAFAVGGGMLLALITIVSLTSSYPNRQHSASFYQFACSTYPMVLATVAVAGKLRWSATVSAMVYLGLLCLMVWLLPLFPASPQIAPIYNRLDHLMPPPFPLLLVVPAALMDALFRMFPWAASRARPWRQAGAAGLVFFILFTGTQWVLSEFLLSDLAGNWFFAGGGKHWPFFLKIEPMARVMFWETPQDELSLARGLAAAALAMLAVRAGLWMGAWMTRLQR